jgi:flagellar protein FliO/FliZ
MIKASLLLRVVALSAALLTLPSVPALAAGAVSTGENTPVDLRGSSSPSHVGSGGGSIVRTIVGLAIVIAVIYGVTWVLRQVKQSRQERAVGGLASVATVPLGSGRSLHLVRAGNELVLVGVAEHGVTPVRTYSEQEARAAGLTDEWGELIEPIEPLAAAATPAPRMWDPQRLSPRALIETIRRWTERR